MHGFGQRMEAAFAQCERGSPDWYLGSLTDEDPRAFTVPLDFLGSGSWIATIYEDGPDADWRANPTPVRITRRLVTAREDLDFALAPGGGTAIRFRPAGRWGLRSAPSPARVEPPLPASI